MFWNLSGENDFFCSKTPKFSDNKYRRTLRETKSNQVWSVSFKASSWVNTAATFWHKNKFKFPHFFPTFKINCLYFLNGKVWFFWHECNILSLFFDFRGATMQFLTKYWPNALTAISNGIKIIDKFVWRRFVKSDSKVSVNLSGVHANGESIHPTIKKVRNNLASGYGAFNVQGYAVKLVQRF